MNRLPKVGVLSGLILSVTLSGCANPDTTYADPPAYIVEQVEELLPAAEQFVAENQTEALEKGVALTASQLELAKRIGVKQPESVRLYYVDRLPLPADPHLEAAARRFGYSSPFIDAYTFGYGIWIEHDAKDDLELLAHELIHVRQTEQLGLQEMVRQYLMQLYIYGYRNAPLEVEAYNEAAKYL
ncbi:DUF4157 domain-containing protein [Pontibacterium sp.]|uniref:eCIS core domain-containing protein n=1 Tax=Pontibacterium sp. TaxID=2036026 RepID=UPI00351954E3